MCWGWFRPAGRTARIDQSGLDMSLEDGPGKSASYCLSPRLNPFRQKLGWVILETNLSSVGSGSVLMWSGNVCVVSTPISSHLGSAVLRVTDLLFFLSLQTPFQDCSRIIGSSRIFGLMKAPWSQICWAVDWLTVIQMITKYGAGEDRSHLQPIYLPQSIPNELSAYFSIGKQTSLNTLETISAYAFPQVISQN